MNVVQKAHSVAGAVIKVHTFFPHGLPGKSVQVHSPGPGGKYRVHQPQHSDHGQRIISFFPPGHRSQRNGPCHICGPVHVLRAGIHQVKSFSPERCRRFRTRHIVRHGSVCSVGRDRRETQGNVFRIPCPHPVQDLRRFRLRHASSRCRRLFHPEQIFRQIHAVPQMGLLHAADLGLVLDTFHPCRGAQRILYQILFPHCIPAGERNSGQVHQHPFALQRAKDRKHLVVFPDLYVSEGFSCSFRQRFRLHEQHTGVLFQKQIGKKHRVAGDI